MATEPLVSVFISVCNSERFLAEAIQSVLDQTFEDFELILINDGSIDGSARILEEFVCKDKRIRVFTQVEQGLIATTNRGLKLARGRYLARLDADDLALPDRLEKQVDFLENNSRVVVVGSAFQCISENGTILRLERPPEHDTAVRWAILFDNPFAHSSVMIRMQIVRLHNLEYPQEVAEDFGFLSTLLEYGQGYNLRNILIKYRLHGKQRSERIVQSTILRDAASLITQQNIRKFGFPLPFDQANKLRHWSHCFPRLLDPQDQMLCLILLDILDAFSVQPGLDRNQLRLVRGRVVLRMLMAHSDERSGLPWKYRLLRRLPPSDLTCVIRYVLHRRWLLRKAL